MQFGGVINKVLVDEKVQKKLWLSPPPLRGRACYARRALVEIVDIGLQFRFHVRLLISGFSSVFTCAC